MTQHVLKNNFARGEFTPKALSRVDLEMYAGGAETLRNFISVPHGGIRRRSGTKLLGYPKNNTGSVAFWEFIYSTTGDAYVIEVGEHYFRFWQEGGYLVDKSAVVTSVSNANPAVVTAATHGFNNGDQVTLTSIPGMTQLNNRRFVVANKTTNTFELQGIDSTTYTAFTSGAGLATTPYEVTHTYSDSEVTDIQFVQVGNAVYIAHQAHPPAKLTRLSASAWSLADVAFLDGPWNAINATEITLTQGGAAADVTVGTSYTVTLANVSAVNDGQGFITDDVGRQLRVKMTKGASAAEPSSTANPPVYAYWASGVITARASTTSITWRCDRVLNPVADTNIAGRFTTGSKSWRLGAFNPTDGYPKCVEVFEGRLVWANTPANPRTMYFSRSGLPADYAPSDADSTVTAQHGFNIDILAGKVDQLLWLREAPRLQVGTSSGIRTVGGSDTGQAISPNSLSQRLEVDIGSSSAAIPLAAGSSRLYATRFGTSLHRLYYDYNINGLAAPNISRLHDHLLTSGVEKLTYQQAPEPIVWVMCENGSVFAMPFDADEKIISYCPQDFGATCKAIASVPGATHDYVLFCMDRTLGAQTVRTIERLHTSFDPLTSELEDGYFVDCGATYSGTATNTVTGLWWLRGESVSVLADGSVKTGLTVSSTGVLTLANGQTASKIHVGKSFTSEFKTLRPPQQQDDGWILGRKQRAASVYVEVLRTGDLMIGTAADNTTIIQNRTGAQPFGTPPNLRGGTYRQKIMDNWDGGQIYGSVIKPHPCFVRSMLINLDVEHS